jgi:mRNA-degrading endonuclease toxin of MazEF toxin-antitoxin module
MSALPKGLKTTGVVLVDQVRAIDRSRRMFDVVEKSA